MTITSLYFSGAEVLTLELKYPVASKDVVIEKYRNMLQAHPNIKIAILGRLLFKAIDIIHIMYYIAPIP